MKKTSKAQKTRQKLPIEGSKITFHVPKRSKIRYSQSDLFDLISLDQSNKGNNSWRGKN